MLELVTQFATFFAHMLATPILGRSILYGPEDYPDLSGQVWVVTGATGGIGLAIALKLAKQNAKIWLSGRDEKKMQIAIERVIQEVPNAKVDSFLADLSDLSTIKPGVARLLQTEKRLNGIIHNAGVMNVPRKSVSAQGIELTVAVNNVGAHLLQKLLDPLIESTPDARIVLLSSLAHTNAPWGLVSSVEVISETTGVRSPEKNYGISKALSIEQAIWWTRTHPDSKVKSISVHPGIIETDIARTTSGWELQLSHLLMWNVDYGTLSPLYAALAPDVPNNAYVVPFGRVGYVRPDILAAIQSPKGKDIWNWLDQQVQAYA